VEEKKRGEKKRGRSSFLRLPPAFWLAMLPDTTESLTLSVAERGAENGAPENTAMPPPYVPRAWLSDTVQPLTVSVP
jgi:hypothetical protein